MSIQKMLVVIVFLLFFGGSFYFLGIYQQKLSGLVGISVEMNVPGVDMVLNDIRLIEKKGNREVIDLLASKAVINNELNNIDLNDIDAILYDPEQAPVNVTSNSGVLNSRTNDFDLKGNVKAISEDGITLLTETLKWDSKRKIFLTDDFVTIKGESFNLTGTGMESSLNPKKLKLNKDVSGIFY